MLKRFLPFLLFLFIGFFALAQKNPPVSELTDKQVQEIIEYIESRGLSESEVELMAKARGYSDSDIAIIRERISQKKNVDGVRKSSFEPKSSSGTNNISREQIGEVSRRLKQEERTDTLKTRKIFGQDIFNNEKLSFEPNLRIATPPDYILGADDELSLDISGYAVSTYDLKVSPEGTVKLENLSPIYVNGLTITAAKEKILQRISMLFAGLRNGSLKMDLTLVKVKTIQVTIIGDVTNPGTYSLSSLSTIFNALYESGGPKVNGSFRNIQLIRNNKVIQTLDIYDFLLKGSHAGNISLQDRDVIFVPIAPILVEVSGEVRRPYQFELKAEDSINDLIKYAGGLTDKAYSKQIKIIRSTGMEKEFFSVTDGQFGKFLLKNGDKLEVEAILDRFANRVEVMGAVFRPGEYDLFNNSTVGKLIKSAEGLREDAFRSRALIKRLGANLDPVMVSVNLDSILLGYDVALKREDVLVIKSIAELRELRSVTIEGKVNIPGEYDYIENMTVNDLIIMAGGLREGGSWQRIEVARRINNPESSDKNVDIFFVDLNESNNVQLGSFVLQPFDIIQVRGLPNYEPQKEIVITGQVVFPGKYSISKRTERISDAIERAGGLRQEAYLKGAQLFRKHAVPGHIKQHINEKDSIKYISRQVAVNIIDVLKDKNSSFNLFMQDGDSLYIPKEMQTIRVSGEVLNPTDVAFEKNLSFRDYITQAGGFTDSAFVRKVYVKYPNGHVDKTKTFLTAKIYPKVEKGMEIIVPVKNRQRMSKAEVISLSTGLVSLSAVFITLFNILR